MGLYGHLTLEGSTDPCWAMANDGTVPLLRSPARRASRRRRPSLDDLLRTHTAELELGAASAEDGGIAPVEVEGLQALFDLVGKRATYLTLAPVAGLLETLGVFMAGDKVANLFQVHKLQLSPAEAETQEEAGTKPPGDVMDLAGFAKLLDMVINSGDVRGAASILPGARARPTVLPGGRR